jgi:hypothetical protein
VAQAVKLLPSECKALSSNLMPPKKKKKKRKEKEEKLAPHSLSEVYRMLETASSGTQRPRRTLRLSLQPMTDGV